MDRRRTRYVICAVGLVWLLSGCRPTTSGPLTETTPGPSAGSAATASTSTLPDFEHVILVLFENKDYEGVIGNPEMPVYNRLAQENVLLTSFYAVAHPSLPNYLALIGGDTFGVTSDCTDCFVDATSLPDLIEQSGRTWKAYEEDMPSPCFLGTSGNYRQKHDPFVYFDPIRLDTTRCEQHVVPMTALEPDLAAGALPNYVFITPNMCNDLHNCGPDVADAWIDGLVSTLVPTLDAEGKPYLIVLMFDEGKDSSSCCGLPKKAGGHIAVVMISPQARPAFQDSTPYSHYSLLKTISSAWGLPYLGHAADDSTALIVAPWK